LLQFETVTPVTAAVMHRTAKFFITSTPKYFALAVAAVSGKLKAILIKKICNSLPLLWFC